ncbi:MAG: hypothetical protein AAGB00_02905 [Planctomycetota bacterium]
MPRQSKARHSVRRFAWLCLGMRCLPAVALVLLGLGAPLAAADRAADLAALRNVSATKAAPAEAQAAWARLAADDPAVLVDLLTAMEGADPAAQNWLRSCFDAAAERAVAADAFPMLPLSTFLYEQNNDPRARRTAFEWIVRVDPGKKARLLEGMLEDQSLSIRYEAVAELMQRAQSFEGSGIGDGGGEGDDAKRALYEKALKAARNPKQIEAIADALGALGVEVDLPGTMGFLKAWHVIGPFDNTGLEDFGTAYPPEADQDLAAEHSGKLGEVAWQAAAAGAEDGIVDFLAPLGKEKEAVAYAYTTFTAADAGPAELRYESKNATKVWLNGKLVASNEVYHSGGGVDQYRVGVTLKKGENTLLVKACQNEQKMPWETEWDFRLRIVDALGSPLASQPSR